MGKQVCEHGDADVVWSTAAFALCPLCLEMRRVDALQMKLDIANAKLAAIAEAEKAERERVANETTGHGFDWALQQMRAGRTVRRRPWYSGVVGTTFDVAAGVLRSGSSRLGDIPQRQVLATDWMIDDAAESVAEPSGRE